MRQLLTTVQRWPLRHPFSISRYTYTESLTATVSMLDADGATGQGECEPHGYDDAIANRVLATAGLQANARISPPWLQDLSRANILDRLERSAARNAVDCALWAMEARSQGVRAHALAETTNEPVRVMPTIGIDTPLAMAQAAKESGAKRWLKVKVGRADGLDPERLEAVAAAVPGVDLLVDVNTGWSLDTLTRMIPLLQRLNVRIVEQPMDPQLDAQMPKPPGDLLFCADESCLDRSSLPNIERHFQYINIKLDKAGGLTEALALRRDAEQRGLGVMVGMMSGTSLAVAPAHLLAQGLEVVDLEIGFMTRDREHPMVIRDDWLLPPDEALWA